MFDFVKEAFYEMPLFVVIVVTIPWIFGVAFGWDDNFATMFADVSYYFGVSICLITYDGTI